VKVLVACEFSGIVRGAFRARGHDAWSCDLIPAEDGSKFHLLGNAEFAIKENNGFFFPLLKSHYKWDLMIAHPPCQYLNHAGVRWLYKDGKRWIKNEAGKVISENPKNEARWDNMRVAVCFFLTFFRSSIPMICVENSEMHPHALDIVGSDPDQTVQPWQFGHPETKATCLWLKNLPPLKPTNIVSGRTPRVHYASPGPDRWKERSRTLQGIADAMAEQWGSL